MSRIETEKLELVNEYNFYLQKLFEQNSAKLENSIKNLLDFKKFIRNYEDVYRECSEGNPTEETLNFLIKHLNYQKKHTIAPIIKNYNQLISCYIVVKNELDEEKRSLNYLENSSNAKNKALRINEFDYDIEKCERRLNMIKNSLTALSEKYPKKHPCITYFVKSNFNINNYKHLSHSSIINPKEVDTIYGNLIYYFTKFKNISNITNKPYLRAVIDTAEDISEKIRITDNANINILPLIFYTLEKKVEIRTSELDSFMEENESNAMNNTQKQRENLNKKLKDANLFNNLFKDAINYIYENNDLKFPCVEEVINLQQKISKKNERYDIEDFAKSLGYTDEELHILEPEIRHMYEEENKEQLQ